MRLCFFGSRNLSKEVVLPIIEREIALHNPDVVVTAFEPIGVCQFAREYCKENNIKLSLHKVDLSKCAGKYHHRSVSVYNDSDYVILIHDGKSNGTQNEYDLARKMGMSFTYYCIQDKVLYTEENKAEWFQQLIEWT